MFYTRAEINHAKGQGICLGCDCGYHTQECGLCGCPGMAEKIDYDDPAQGDEISF
jgi:hypothetical protein